MRVIMDADSLIKQTKAKAKEVILKSVEACIPPKVFEETVVIPKEEGYPDACLIEENVVELYKAGKITIGEAAELAGVSLRRMLDILAEHGVMGTVKMKQQVKALDYAKNLSKTFRIK